MAAIGKHEKGWRAQVYVNGQRRTKVCRTKVEAEQWAKWTEAELRKTTENPGKALTFGKLLEKYAEEVSPTKRGEKWEQIRLKAIQRDPIANIILADLKPSDVAAWRDRRLKAVKSSSVIRELTLLKHALEVARRDWQLITSNPAKDVRRPPSQPHRERRISDEEVTAICAALGYWGGTPVTVQHRVACAFLFALETAMRSGEICALLRTDIEGRTARLRMTKNGQARSVPLSARAIEIIELISPSHSETTLFGLSDKSRDATFRQAVKRAGIKDLTFHDSRHESVWRLSKKLSVMDLARVTGHKDLRQLLQYYNATAEELAARL